MEVDTAREELQARCRSLTQQKEGLEKLLTEAEKTSEQQQEQVDGLQAENARLQATIRKLQQQLVILHADVTAVSHQDKANPASLFQSHRISDTVGTDGLVARLKDRSMDTLLPLEEIDAASAKDCAALKQALHQMHNAVHAAEKERDMARRELREYREEAVSLRELVKTMEAAATNESSTARSRTASTRSADEEARALRTELLATKQELEATQHSLDDLRQQLADAEDQQGMMNESLQESRVEVRELRERLDEVTSNQDLSFADELNEVQSWRHLSLDEQRYIINIKNRLVEQHGMIKSDLMDLKLVHADVCQLLQRVFHEACEREEQTIAALSSWFAGSHRRQLLHRLHSNPLKDMFDVKAYTSSY